MSRFAAGVRAALRNGSADGVAWPWILLLASLAVRIGLLIVSGPRTAPDSGRYLVPADFDLAQWYPRAIAARPQFAAYISLVSAAQWIFGAHAVAAVAWLQSVVAALGPVWLFLAARAVRPAFAPFWIALGAFVLGNGLYDAIQWDVFLLTDSLYLTLGLLLVWRLAGALHGGEWWSVLALAVLLFFWRPSGQVFLPLVALLYIWMHAAGRWPVSRRQLAALLLAAAAASAVLTAGFAQVMHDPPAAVADSKTYKRYKDPNARGVVVDGREETYRAPPAKSADYFVLVWSRYAHMFRFDHAGYSPAHSAYNWLYFAFAFGLALVGAWRLWRGDSHDRLLLGAGLLWVHGVCWFYALYLISYDYRYQLIVLPVVWLLALVGLGGVAGRLSDTPAPPPAGAS